jgi:tRNA modification GTPase
MDSTIFALASAAGRAGVAVLRLSGPAAGQVITTLTGRVLPPARRMMRARLIDPRDGRLIDDGLAVWFPGPASFTGEDIAELHVHGGRAVIAALLDCLAAQPDCRLAAPGEFTRRAFERGKMDLTEAEGLADLVAAETEAQRHQALRQMEGDLGVLYETWRERLMRSLAHLEASIDFADEDLPQGLLQGVRRAAAEVGAEIADHLADGRRGERLRDGMEVVIVGAPNAGKSSILNVLARREAAIVSEIAGTTRDVVEVHLDLGGYPVVVADTAGLRESGDVIEREGVRRARARAERADLKIALFDASELPALDSATQELIDGDTLVVVNKADLKKVAGDFRVHGHAPIAISAKTGEGITALLDAVTTAVAERLDVTGAPALTRQRHRLALEDCLAALERFVKQGEAAGGVELAAEDLRLAVRALGRITGRVGVEEMLDVVFRDFCIGK